MLSATSSPTTRCSPRRPMATVCRSALIEKPSLPGGGAVAEPEQEPLQQPTAVTAHLVLELGDLALDAFPLGIVGRRVQLLPKVSQLCLLVRTGIDDAGHSSSIS